MLSLSTQRLCAWCGSVTVIFFIVSFIFTQFVPPPGPSMTQEEVAAMYQQNSSGIRIGMLFIMVSSMFLSPLVAVISVQMRRIEDVPILTYVQLSAGTVTVLTLLVPAVLFLVTAFRPDRSPELTYLMNDLSWFMWVIVWPPYFIQYVAIGICILKDKRPQPIFPRWVGYFQFWVVLQFMPATLLPFFKAGPFAWNGFFPFWLPAPSFFAWFIIMQIMLLKAINRQEQEGAR